MLQVTVVCRKVEARKGVQMLVHVKDVVRDFKISERHIRKLIAEGRIPFYKLSPKVIRLDPEELKNYMRLIAEGKPKSKGKGSRRL